MLEFAAILALSGAVLYLNNTKDLNELQFAEASTSLTFKAEPEVIKPGQSVTLSWSAPGLSDVYINNGIGSVDNEGIEVVFPKVGDTYVIKGYLNGKEYSEQILIKRSN